MGGVGVGISQEGVVRRGWRVGVVVHTDALWKLRNPFFDDFQSVVIPCFLIDQTNLNAEIKTMWWTMLDIAVKDLSIRETIKMTTPIHMQRQGKMKEDGSGGS